VLAKAPQGILSTDLMGATIDVDFDFACVGRTLPSASSGQALSDVFDFDLAFDLAFDFDSDREGHGFSRAAKLRIKSTRLQPLRAVLAVEPQREMVPVPSVPTFVKIAPTIEQGKAGLTPGR
jgi:hypothetical protein